MKAYTYSPEEVGVNGWPPGTLRLNCESTTNPAEADVFIYPGALHEVKRRALWALPYMEQHADRHIFFHCSDHSELYDRPCRFIRCNTRTWYFKQDVNVIPWPWPVEDFSACIDPPDTGFKFDVSFHGWNWSEARKRSVQSLHSTPELKSDIATYRDFCGYIYDTPEGVRRRGEFRRSMRESRVALCPESIPGVLPYRFFEAMSAARIPVLVGSDYCLPMSDEIPYADFIVTVAERDAGNVGGVIRDYLARTPDEQLIAKGLQARHYYETWLHRDKWVDLMTYAVEKAIRA